MKKTVSLFLLISISLLGVKKMNKFPIIYSKHYNINILRAQKFHPFDTTKYGKIYRHLKKQFSLKSKQFYQPQMVTEKDLLLIHTEKYLNSLKKSKNIARVAEVSLLAYLPNLILQKKLLKPMRWATGGTILGVELALRFGWAVNLSGGYHHAKAEKGEGFCFFADIPIALKKIWMLKPHLKTLIVDLDAHQGNGVEMGLGSDKRVAIFDMYTNFIYPDDNQAKKFIDFHYPIAPFTMDEEYLHLLKEKIPLAIQEFKPNLIIYNAGTDIYEKDPLGKLKISKAGIIKRDEFIFKQAIQNKIPILMVLSGGYHKDSFKIVSESIENLLKNVIK